MMQIWILCRSLTYAQRAAAILERKGFTALVSRAPQGTDPRGCGYAVKIKRRAAEAVTILRDAQIPFGKIYEQQDGVMKEVVL